MMAIKMGWKNVLTGVEYALQDYERALETARRLAREFEIDWQGIDHGGQFRGVISFVLQELAEKAQENVSSVEEQIEHNQRYRAGQARWYLHDRGIFITLSPEEKKPLFIVAGSLMDTGPGWATATEALLEGGYTGAITLVQKIIDGLLDGTFKDLER